MHLVPALAVLYAQSGVIVQEALRDLRLAFACYRNVQGRYSTSVTIVGRGAQLQQCAV